MTVKAKRFRIGVEGATTDGREIQREWLEQMAASYNPAVYTALINLEHIKSYLPDSTFNRYGKVTALFAEEITEGPLAGKMALYADVEPTESLVELVKKGQKLFTSMEVSPKFADTGKAYLVGLAATDDPASLGTEMLTFSASAAHNPLANRKQNPANLFTAAEETVIELEEIQEDKPSLFARVTALFTKKEQSDDARFSDVHKKGRIKRQMFAKLRTTKYLKTAASADSASVQFEGKVQRIARVHHYGLRDRVSRKGPEVRYAERRLLGVNNDVEAMTRDMILQWLAG
ncbi:phage virion morphogenesis protein [Escherichia coli]|nr:phage virion morphogenesis protein [Escherichia coli]